MKVHSVLEYDQSNDQILGPFNQVQIVMARGLFNQWKQVIYFDYDKKMTAKILFEIIAELNCIHFPVVACVSDCGGGNQGLWSELQISIEKTYFQNPVTNSKIFIFADAPHLIKLLRNWFIDTGFIFSDRTLIHKSPIESLIKETNSEINSCFKLTELHLKCEKTQRQNVRLATQLFSHTTAEAVKRYLPGNNKKIAADTSEFIEKVNMWFDLMNTYQPNNFLISKKPYGSATEEQNIFLDDFYSIILNMRCCNKSGLQVFQKGILISISSLKQLFQEMKNNYDAKYILTHRLNQDVLENFFSQLRTRGGLNDHPTPLHVKFRIRMILLGKNVGQIRTKCNTNIECADEYISSQIFKEINIEIEPLKLDSESDTGSSSEAASPDTKSKITTTSEDDGFEYVVGWMAKKLKEKYPYLGSYTGTSSCNEHDYASTSTWVQTLSFGALIKPSEQWLREAQFLNNQFKRYHKKAIRKGPGVTNKLIKKILKNPQNKSPDEVVKLFIRQRTFIRMKYLHRKNMEEKVLKRKKNLDKNKINKKMRKVVN